MTGGGTIGVGCVGVSSIIGVGCVGFSSIIGVGCVGFSSIIGVGCVGCSIFGGSSLGCEDSSGFGNLLKSSKTSVSPHSSSSLSGKGAKSSGGVCGSTGLTFSGAGFGGGSYYYEDREVGDSPIINFIKHTVVCLIIAYIVFLVFDNFNGSSKLYITFLVISALGIICDILGLIGFIRR